MCRSRLAWLASIPLVASVVACDGRSDEELRAMIGDVVQQHLNAAEAADPTEPEPPVKDDDEPERVAGLEKRIDELQARLAVLEARAAVIEIPAVPPEPIPAPVPGAGAPASIERFKIPIGEAHSRGYDDALVTVVVWSDFECPHCARVEPTREQIEKEYGPDVRFAFKHCPLSSHPHAKPAAIAAEAAGEQGKFWEMHDKLFENHTDLSDANFVTWAGEIGLDVKRFERDLADGKLERRVQSQRDECNRIGVVGVPSFHVNGRYVEDGSFAGLKPVIDDEKRKSEALVAKGIAREGVYDATIADGKTGG